MKAKTRFKQNNCIIYIFITISFVWNLINTFQFYPREKEVQFDYIGVIVAILSILVTVLVCWNIFNYIQFERRVKEYVITETETKLRKKIDNVIERTDLETKKLLILVSDTKFLTKTELYTLSSLSFIERRAFDTAITMLYQGIANCLRVTNREKPFNDALGSLKEIIKLIPPTTSIPENQLSWFRNISNDSCDSQIIEYTEKLIEYNKKRKGESK